MLFFMLLYLSLMALTSLPIWRDEKLLFLRERDSGAYGTPAYFAAVVLFDLLPMRILPPTFFALFSYWMIGLHKSSAVCLLWFIGVLRAVVVAASGCPDWQPPLQAVVPRRWCVHWPTGSHVTAHQEVIGVIPVSPLPANTLSKKKKPSACCALKALSAPFTVGV